MELGPDMNFSHTTISSRLKAAVSASVLGLLIISTSAFADGQKRDIPGITHAVVYEVPANIADLSEKEVEQLLERGKSSLTALRADTEAPAKAEERMFSELMRHDLIRLKIGDVIKQMVSDFGVEGDFAKKLMGYRSTFMVDLLEERNNVHNLQDYPAYDFRFTAVYMSLLFAFQEHPEFYKMLRADMDSETSPIGEYRKVLDHSFAEVEKARKEMDAVHNVEDLEKVIDALNQELVSRKG
jgi:hypothetical protein|tara:strand:+ start:40025 stop:40747 length:723 start_codon:yes stop_codon:yes gene_type:complete